MLEQWGQGAMSPGMKDERAKRCDSVCKDILIPYPVKKCSYYFLAPVVYARILENCQEKG